MEALARDPEYLLVSFSMYKLIVPSTIHMHNEDGSAAQGKHLGPEGEFPFSPWVLDVIKDPLHFGTGVEAIIAGGEIHRILSKAREGQVVYLEDTCAELLQKAITSRSDNFKFLPFFNIQCVAYFVAVKDMKKATAEELTELASQA